MADDLIEELSNSRFATWPQALDWCFRAAEALASKDAALSEMRAERDGMIARCRTAEADLELWQLQADNLRAQLEMARKALVIANAQLADMEFLTVEGFLGWKKDRARLADGETK